MKLNKHNAFKIGKLIVAVITIATIALEAIYADTLEADNIKLTLRLQRWNQTVIGLISWIFGTVGLAWIIIFLLAYFLLHSHHVYMLYTFTLTLAPLFLIFGLKAIYYRSRPFLLHRDIRGCICDPGMPSGHSALAVMIHTLAYRHLSYRYLNDIKYRVTRNVGKLTLA